MADSSPSFGWGHINLNVRNLDRSIAFYRLFGFDIFLPGIPYLGLSLNAEAAALSNDMCEALGVPAGTKGRACIMGLDDGFPKLDLTEFSGVAGSSPLANSDLGLVRICLTSENLAADVTRLKNKGVEFLTDAKSGHSDLANVAVCRDPDGALIEIIQVYLDRWASLLGAPEG
ncbi:MAG: VOC family protein [Pseudomonadota bacterium]